MYPFDRHPNRRKALGQPPEHFAVGLGSRGSGP